MSQATAADLWSLIPLVLGIWVFGIRYLGAQRFAGVGADERLLVLGISVLGISVLGIRY
jgi:hypothetical protein